jgi:hypothetical protein
MIESNDLRKLRSQDADTIQNDPASSYWLKNALAGALVRDSVDALRDAETLVRVLRERLAPPMADLSLDEAVNFMADAGMNVMTFGFEDDSHRFGAPAVESVPQSATTDFFMQPVQPVRKEPSEGATIKGKAGEGRPA